MVPASGSHLTGAAPHETHCNASRLHQWVRIVGVSPVAFGGRARVRFGVYRGLTAAFQPAAAHAGIGRRRLQTLVMPHLVPHAASSIVDVMAESTQL